MKNRGCYLSLQVSFYYYLILNPQCTIYKLKCYTSLLNCLYERYFFVIMKGKFSPPFKLNLLYNILIVFYLNRIV